MTIAWTFHSLGLFHVSFRYFRHKIPFAVSPCRRNELRRRCLITLVRLLSCVATYRRVLTGFLVHTYANILPKSRYALQNQISTLVQIQHPTQVQLIPTVIPEMRLHTLALPILSLVAALIPTNNNIALTTPDGPNTPLTYSEDFICIQGTR
ncbi:uncharacterized protein BDR25DRAFT_354677 [Lindgomyces ingoldianus]|uniref:Uncharacterized protein n=1 Tax=Lindgomyces ingoldianus TaxID=673940 RepID=A0ACB6QXA5_9PLEO|nr:uncharacterized protein BDR25DRAFT_354677 [Lindgomyces ingoldianus]KAF2471437.1 hypothetical protein BDR25DRAFT_354677 [Lindgomyces ingoldianus]